MEKITYEPLKDEAQTILTEADIYILHRLYKQLQSLSDGWHTEKIIQLDN